MREVAPPADGGANAGAQRAPVLVLGLGNLLQCDDGVGVRAIERLAVRYLFPHDVVLLDGGTKGLELLPHLEDASSLLILDAVLSDGEPGTLVRLAGREIPSGWKRHVSMHQAGFADVLAAAALQDVLPVRMVLWGVHPAHIGWGVELTPVVADKLDELVESAVTELRSWGLNLREVANDPSD